ncbi:SDR family oxidoreductase [Flavobacteriaceae bacterium]|jgi:short-subunit dehydrogenase|nr:SDR family oxidoreductase [Flavobacteriaceae bacterium]MDA9846724.1 SDR family oxidoreductase [Flavobacteriaceae bacterium]MDC3301039.1 SDR family oxidoreductase [Flavobacteriaceae bacterium]MDG1673088.1 SDR family NAD(P)-dependent oxidoreductase [Flavobacteriaceae bacterium]MDG2483438.1 SDR family NAD(P)-dependent oxidoreductase [Flavobacteriaceae bacterium]
MKPKKTVIITGTSRGIGFELVHLFSKAGYAVLALSRNAKPVINLNYENITALSFDLNNVEDYNRVETFVQNEWTHVDILINNAGAIINKPFAETTFDDFKQIYGTNVFGVAELTRRVLPFIPKTGHVVTISSMGGVQGSMKFAGLSAYSSSKGAVITLTELLAEEYKEAGPSFNVLALGAVQTEMLAEAFPGYKAPTSPIEMAAYIFEFAKTGQQFYNGKLLQVSSSTP